MFTFSGFVLWVEFLMSLVKKFFLFSVCYFLSRFMNVSGNIFYGKFVMKLYLSKNYPISTLLVMTTIGEIFTFNFKIFLVFGCWLVFLCDLNILCHILHSIKMSLWYKKIFHLTGFFLTLLDSSEKNGTLFIATR